MSFVFFFISLVCIAILFTDFKLHPTDNAVTRFNNALSSNEAVAQIFSKIEPHSSKFGAPPVLAIILALCALIFVCAVIF